MIKTDCYLKIPAGRVLLIVYVSRLLRISSEKEDCTALFNYIMAFVVRRQPGENQRIKQKRRCCAESKEKAAAREIHFSIMRVIWGAALAEPLAGA